MKYRRRKTSDTYHWCTRCSNWPTKKGSYIEVVTPGKARPRQRLDLCNQCRSKERRGACTPR